MGGSVKLKNPDTGMVWDFTLPLPPGVQTLFTAGQLHEVEDELLSGGAGVPQPRGNASHQAWIDYAATQGMERAQAAAMTRDEIRVRFTAPSFDPDAPPVMED